MEAGGENFGARASGDETAVSDAEEGRLGDADMLQWVVELLRPGGPRYAMEMSKCETSHEDRQIPGEERKTRKREKKMTGR